jgi:hypothetical protein
MSSLALSDDQILLLRLRAQRLVPQFAQEHLPPDRLLVEVGGIQAQELPAGLLGMRARDDQTTVAEIERARLEDHTIVRTWCMRGTLHLLAAEDTRWLVPMLGPGLIASGLRRLNDLGWDEDRIKQGKRLLQEALEKQERLSRKKIADLLKRHHLPSEGQSPIHLIAHAALEGWLCLGPGPGPRPEYVLFEKWIGNLQPMPREEALARLARRYFSAYAPASLADFALWSGLKIGEARAAIASIDTDILVVETSIGQMVMLKTQLPWIDDLPGHPPVLRLLPRFDDTILGYTNRDLSLQAIGSSGTADKSRVLPGGGMILQTINLNGSILGGWKMNQHRGGIEVVIEPFAPLPEALQPAIDKEIQRIGKFFGVAAQLHR